MRIGNARTIMMGSLGVRTDEESRKIKVALWSMILTTETSLKIKSRLNLSKLILASMPSQARSTWVEIGLG
jgi:hypothetical protein